MIAMYVNLYKSPKVFSPEYLRTQQIRMSLFMRERKRERGKFIRDVQEAIVILVLFIDTAHESGGGWENLIYKDEDRLLWRELYALADHVDELAHGEVGGDEILLLVDGSDVRLLDLLTDNLYGELVSQRSGEGKGGGKDMAGNAHIRMGATGDLEMTHWDTISVFLADALGLSLPLLEGVLVLELGPHS
jgi:hypothetical protein